MVALVVSQYNVVYAQGLVDHAVAELRRMAPAVQILLHQVPGAFEIPLIVQELADGTGTGGVRPDAILALGVIFHGETDHAEQISRSVTETLLQIALHYRLPVIHQVISVRSEQQARVRCLEPTFNRGTEGARAAVEMVRLLASLGPARAADLTAAAG